MIELWSALTLALQLLRGEVPALHRPPECPRPRTCAVLVPRLDGASWTCMRRHKGGPCAPRRRP